MADSVLSEALCQFMADDNPSDLELRAFTVGWQAGIAFEQSRDKDRIAAAVAAERERCAKLCDDVGNECTQPDAEVADECADAIRGETSNDQQDG